MSIWFIVNAFAFIFAMYKVFSGYIGIHIIFGGIGVTLILYNWTRHAVFSTIRSNISRQRKIVFAQLSKKALPLHKYTGTAALLFILLHAGFVLQLFGWQGSNLKMLSGLFTLLILIAMVIVGWLRFIKTTYRRRMIHLYLGFCLFFAVVLHLLLV